MKPAFVYHHLGMGDHLTCSGLIRTLLGRPGFSSIRLFTKECNATNVRFLYRDEPRVGIVPLEISRDDPQDEVETVLAAAPAGEEVIRIGHDHYDRVAAEAGGYIQNDQVFYRQFGVPYEYRFDRFFFVRDKKAETTVLERLGLIGIPYIFVDCDASRGRPVPSSVFSAKRSASTKIVYNDVSIPLLHMGALLEGADEIHVSESAIRCLVEGSIFDMRKPKLFLEGNLRGNNTRLPWKFSSGETAFTYPMYQLRGQFSGANSMFPGLPPTVDGHLPGPFAIRRVRPGDDKALAEVFATLDGDPHFSPHPMTTNHAQKIVARSGRNVYALAFFGDVSVAYGLLRGFDEGYAVPRLGIAVAPKWRGTGVGRRMMKFLHEEAWALGSSVVELRVHPDNAGAIKMYRAFGYKNAGAERGQLLMRRGGK